jgi:predicted dienelactone hydrolase
MRLLEITIPILLVVYLLWRHPRPLVVRLLPALGLIVTLIHFAFEGNRWQMIPLYMLTPLLAISSLTKITGKSDWKPPASTLTVILVALATVLPALLPVPHIPIPSGPYQIGTSILELTDESRAEIYSGKDEPRRFMVQIWYPADAKADDERAPWMTNAKIYAPAIATYIDLPSYFLDHLALVEIPAYKDAAVAVADEAFPIILFSHGWNGFNAQNTGQALELASRGFIVIAMQHTYGAVTTVFPDGTVAPNNPRALPASGDEPNYEEVARILVNQWAGDMSFLLDQLTAWNEAGEHPFFQKLDLSRVGAYGHSTGGGGVIQFCGSDPRCKAVLGMDPFMRPVSAEVIAEGIAQPSFYMFSEGWYELTDSKNNKLFNQFYPSVGNSFGVIGIAGTKHFDFSDLPLLSPIAPQLGLKGPLNGARVTEIVNAYLVEFFESTLLGRSSDLFSGAFRDFPEIKKLK